MAFARLIGALLSGNSFTLYGNGEQSRDFTFVADAVSATIAAMEKGSSGTTYNVGGGSEISLNEAITLCEELAGNRLEVRTQPAARGDVRRAGANTTRIRSDVGWHPQTPLRRGLELQISATRAAVGIG
jgi:UDP-glucuronate 4-epimerase